MIVQTGAPPARPKLVVLALESMLMVAHKTRVSPKSGLRSEKGYGHRRLEATPAVTMRGL